MFKAQYNLAQNKQASKKARRITLWIFLAIICFLWVMPFLLMMNTSFRTLGDTILNGITSLPTPYTTLPYNNAVVALDLGQSFLTSLIVTIASNVTIIFFSSLAAWQLARSKTWWAKMIFYGFLITIIVPFQAIMLPLISVMGRIQFLNLPGLIFMYTGFGMSISIFMMHGFLSNIPLSLEEAARVEGYNPLRVYWQIILPLLKPIIVTIIILNTVWIWNDFLLPYLVYIADTNAPTTTVVKLKTGLVGAYGTDVTAIMAGLTVLIIPIIIFFTLMQRNIIAGITTGAVK